MVLPPSTAMLCPLMYAAAGLAKNAVNAATSSGLPNLPAGISANISASISSIWLLVFAAFELIIFSKRTVLVAPGKTLFTVIPYLATSKLNVFAQPATAALVAFETPKPFNGCFTEVEIILIILPQLFFSCWVKMLEPMHDCIINDFDKRP